MDSLYLIAEIGINHNGNIDNALKMIDSARSSGWDAVKFQKRTVEAVYSKDVLDSHRDSPWGKTTRDQKNGLEFGAEEYGIIDSYCRETGIEWFASAWDVASFEFLEKFNPPANKISSAMTADLGLARAVAKTGRLTYISTGASSFVDVCKIVDVFESEGCDYVIMHCVMQYPVDPENSGLAQIKTIDRIFRVSEQFPRYRGVGYSGHESPRDLLPSYTAIALGARYIERHITLDREQYGSDQKASIEPDEMAELRNTGNRMIDMLGDGRIRLAEIEKVTATRLRGHIKN